MNTLRLAGIAKNNRGFTLIELMIAIAIVGVLASIAVPAFSNYLARARVSEAINYIQSCKTGYLEYYATQGALPTNTAQANCPSITTENIASVTVTTLSANPRIIALMANAAPLPPPIRNQRIVLQPLAADGSLVQSGERIVSWRCSVSTSGNQPSAPDALDLVPAICRQNVL